MIAFLRGILFEKNTDGSVIIDVNGVGYKVFVPNRVSGKMEIGQEAFLHTFHKVAEGVNDLYGMDSVQDLQLFSLLLSVSGIGPKSALALCEMHTEHVQNAIETEDIGFLTKAPGLGKKTASRMILELKGKLPNLSGLEATNKTVQSPFLSAQSALESLGFHKKDIEKAFSLAPKDLETKTDEEMVKWGLGRL